MSTSPDSQSDLDDIFSTDNSSTEENGDFGLPELDVDASSAVSESNPFNNFDDSAGFPESSAVSDNFGLSDPASVVALSDSSISDEEPVPGKGGKKAKRGKKEKPEKKAQVAKAAKVKKEKKAKFNKPADEPEVEYDKAARRAVLVFAGLLALVLVAVNVYAFVANGVGAGVVMFAMIFDALGAVLLAFTALWAGQIKKGRWTSVFDTFVALACVFAIMAVMVLVSSQAKYYGMKIKATYNENAAVETLRC